MLTADEQRRRRRECMRRLRATPEYQRRQRWKGWSLEEIAEAVGLRLSPQSSLDPVWWERQMFRYHLY